MARYIIDKKFFSMKYLLFIIISFLIVSCDTGETKNEISKVQFKKSFEKNWITIDSEFPFNSKLSLKSDNSYQYEYRSGLNKGFSKGEWHLDSPFVILNSYTIDTCMYLSKFGVNCLPVSENKEIDNIINTTTIKGCRPLTLVDYVTFEMDSFYLSKDTLIYVQNIVNIHCPIKHVFVVDSL